MNLLKQKLLEDKIRAIYKERFLENEETDLIERAVINAEILFQAGLFMEAKKIYLRLLELDPEDETIKQKLNNLDQNLN